jgi:phage repressor protein C with HTH and peptisase S24 domain
MIKNNEISERIAYIIDNQYNGNKKKFSESINFSPQVISNIVSGRKSKPSFDVIKAILSTNDNINAEWLINGKEPMLKNQFPKTKIEKQVEDTKKLINKRFIDVIKFIISENPKIKKSEIAESLNIGSSTLSEILKQRMNVSVDILSLLSIHYNLSLEWLVNGSGEMLKNQKAKAPRVISENHTPQVITIDKYNEDNIVMVAESAHAGYLHGFGDPEFIGELPTYSLPNLRNGIFRMFQVAGFSMLPTLHHHSVVAGQFIENWQNDIKDNRVYVLVTKDHGIVVKRCLNRFEKYGNLYCKSDNRKEFPSFQLEKKDISEIWEVKMALLYDLSDPAELHDKVNDLESELLMIKNHLNIGQNYLQVAEKGEPYTTNKPKQLQNK